MNDSNHEFKLGWNLDETTTGINEIEKEKSIGYEIDNEEERHMEKCGYRKPRFISKQAPESCRIEGKTFTHNQLEQILKQLYSWNNGLYSCTQCEYRTKQRWAVMVHTQKHLENFEVDCTRCGKIFKSYESLRNHKNTTCPFRI